MKKEFLMVSMLVASLGTTNILEVSVEAQEVKENYKVENKVTKSINREAVYNLIKQFYKGFQNREGDTSGVKYWAEKIISSQLTVADVIERFIDSEEFINMNVSDEEFIKRSYIAILGRTPDYEGLQHWLSFYKKGYSKRYILQRHFYSSEFSIKLAGMGISNKGVINITLNDKRPAVEEVVKQFYEGFHGRVADSSGLEYWTDKIVFEKLSLAEIVDYFINSDEFLNFNNSAEQFIVNSYTAMFGRAPDKEGLTFWMNKYMDGHSKRYILKMHFESPEFKNFVNSVGIKKIGNIKVTEKDFPGEMIAKARIINTEINLRSKPLLSARTDINLKIGTNVTLLDRVKGDETYYKVKVVHNGKIEVGYIRKTVSWKEVVDIYSDNEKNEYLGVISEKYESNGDPGLISTGSGDYGGKSYGAWQFSSTMGSLDEFVNSLNKTNTKFYQRLKNGKNDDGGKFGENFDREWKDIAKESYEEFYQIQHSFIMDKYYNQALRKILAKGNFEEELKSFSARNVIWSTAVQHGVTGSSKILIPRDIETNVYNFINSVYKERGRKDENGQLVHFANNSQAVQDGVAKRFINENRDSIRILNIENGKNVESPEETLIKDKFEAVKKKSLLSEEEASKQIKEYLNDDDIYLTNLEVGEYKNSLGYRVNILSEKLYNDGGNGYLFSIFITENGDIEYIN